MRKIWQVVVAMGAVLSTLSGAASAEEAGSGKVVTLEDLQATKYELKIEEPRSALAPIYYSQYQQAFFRPSLTFSKVYNLKAFANTVPGTLAKFAAIANERSSEAWNIITSESQQYIIDTMAEAWHKNNPDEKVESEAKLKDNMRALFEEPDNQVAKIFWQAYFIGTFGEMEYKIDLDKLSFKDFKEKTDKEVVTIGSRTFVLVKEKSQWKVDIINSKLELEQ